MVVDPALVCQGQRMRGAAAGELIGGRTRMYIARSQKHYDDARKAAVVSRLNRFIGEHTSGQADWGELFAELIEAYVQKTKLTERKVLWF